MQIPTNPVTISLPLTRPFRLILEVTPVHGTAHLPGLGGGEPRKLITPPERLDLTVTVEELPEVERD